MKKLIIIFLLFCKKDTFAQEATTIQTDRPNNMETAYTVPKKCFQAEVGLAFEDDKPVYRNLVYPNVLLKYGIAKNIELRASSTFARFENYTPQGAVFSKSFLPLLVGTKINFLQQKKYIPKTTVNCNIGIPSIASKQYQLQNNFIISKILATYAVNSKLSLNANAGFEYQGKQVGIDKIFIVGFSYSLTNKIAVCVEEYNYMANQNRSINQFNVGGMYLLKSNIQFDVNASLGLNALAPNYYVGCGVSFLTNKLNATSK